MIPPHISTTDRRVKDSPNKSPSPLVLLILVILFLRSQLYIARTFSGLQPSRRHIPIASNVVAAEREWQPCAEVITKGLKDIGDAGRVWLENSGVGTAGANIDGQYGCRCLIPEVHAQKQPKLTAIVQSFNHHANIANITKGLRAGVVEEVVISEDGSTDGSLHDWHHLLDGKGDFIIRSNNLHELRSYNRAMRMSSGDIVVLLQDDDLLPMTDEWLRNAMKLFEALPQLGILGGYIGQLWDHATGQGFEYGEQVSTHGGLRKGDTKPLPHIEPVTGLPFMYAECVWIAPMFIRRSLLRKVGGLELTIARKGEPGVWQDCVLSYEAWVNGFTVGAYSAEFERGVGGHGSATSSAKVKQRERVYERAIAFSNRKFPRRRIHEAIVALNNNTLTRRSLR